MWIEPTRKKIGRHKVGEAFQASRRDARVYIACKLAKEVSDPNAAVEAAPKVTKKKTAKKRAYKRRDMTAEK